MKVSRDIYLGFLFIFLGVVAIAVAFGIFSGAKAEVCLAVTFCSWVFLVSGLLISFVSCRRLMRELRESRQCTRSRELELLTYVGNRASEYLVEKNSSFLIEDKKRFYPIFLKHNADGIDFILTRKEGVPSERSTVIMKATVNISHRVGGSTTLSLGIVKENDSKSYYSLVDFDKFIGEIYQNIKRYELPAE